MKQRLIALLFALVGSLSLNGESKSAYDKFVEGCEDVEKECYPLLRRKKDASREEFWNVVQKDSLLPSKALENFLSMRLRPLILAYYDSVVESDSEKKKYVEARLREIKSAPDYDISSNELVYLRPLLERDEAEGAESVEQEEIKAEILLSGRSRCLVEYEDADLGLVSSLSLRKKDDTSNEGFWDVLENGPLHSDLESDDESKYLERKFQLLRRYVECRCKKEPELSKFLQEKLRNTDLSCDVRTSRLSGIFGSELE